MELNEKMLSLGSKRSIIREIFEYGKMRKAEIGAENVFDFSLGNPSVEPPKKVAEVISRLVFSGDQTLLHGYTSAQGDANVRSIIAENLNKKYGANINKDLLYMTCGAAASLAITLKAVINEGEECIVFAPFFTEYRVFVENAGAKLVVSIPKEKTFDIDVEDFTSRITEKTRAVIINSPNNPSGVVYPENTVKELCAVLEKKSREFGRVIYLISDEPYRALTYGDVKVPFLMNYYNNTVVCYSYSKALSLPGERIGYIAVSPKTENAEKVYLAICGAGRSLGYVCAPSLFQKVVAECDDITADVSVYEENRNILYEGLTKAGFECVMPRGAFYLFVKAKGDDATAFYKAALKHEILVVPCDDFGVKGYVRIAYCVKKSTVVNSLPAFISLAKEYK